MKIFFILTVALLPIFGFSNFDNTTGQTINAENEEELYFTSQLYAIARQGQRAVDAEALVVGFSEIVDRVYSVSDRLQLISTKKEGRTVINSWPLTRWIGESSSTKFNSFTLPYTDNSFGNELRQEIDNSKKGLGCLNETPLRYGDINSDQSKEIVLLLGEFNHTLDMVVFSPDQERTIFGVRLALHDSQDNEYGEYSNYDYIATLDLRSAYQAYRSYAKVFLMDLDADNKTPDDIVVWRKAYLANHKDNTVKGFSLDGSLLRHFAFLKGEYVLQETTEADIQNWLAENDLSWSKGYPSISECPGEKGKLIPEMHDPLLNDPDVLR